MNSLHEGNAEIDSMRIAVANNEMYVDGSAGGNTSDSDQEEYSVTLTSRITTITTDACETPVKDILSSDHGPILTNSSRVDVECGAAAGYSSFQSRRQTIKLILIGICLACITNFPSAFMHTSVNTAVNELNQYLNRSYNVHRGRTLEAADFSLIRSIMHSIWYAGQVFGALISPYVCDTYGRKPAYLISTAAMMLACLLQMVATLFPFPEVLISGRVLASIFSPMSDAVAILYFQEISPPNLRGTLSSLFALGYSAMALLGMILGIKHLLGHSLTLLFSVPIVPAIFALLFLAYIPETPKFLLISKNNYDSALSSLKFYQGIQDQDANSVLTSYRQEQKNESPEHNSLISIFRVSHLRKAMILSIMVMVLTMPFYPILQSSTYILLNLGVSMDFAQISSTSLMVALTLCCVFSAFLLDKFGRRTLILWGGMGSVLFLLMFILCASGIQLFGSIARIGSTIALTGYIVCYGLTIGPISYFIAPELVPLQNRSALFCVCFSFSSALVVLTNFSTIPLYEMIGPIAFAPLFVVPSTFALLYLYLCLPETKDHETHEIVALLKRNRKMAKISSAQANVPQTIGEVS